MRSSVRSSRWAACAGLLVSCLLASSVRAGESDDLATRVDAYLAPLVRTNNFSGVVLVARNGAPVFQRAYGLAHIEQAALHKSDTRFQIASLSKPFTSAAVLLLVQRGQLDLHAPLEKVLPGYPQGSRLTVHHLLTHRSGIPNINDFPEYEQVQANPHTPGQLVAYFKDKPLQFTPGERYDYSNSNYNLLAYVIERVSGMPYARYIEQEITRPLGLHSTGHRDRMADIVPGLATGYAPHGNVELERAQYLDWSTKTGNGSLHSTAGDLARFAQAMHGPRLLSDASRALIYAAHSANVGYGWFLSEANGKQVHHVNGRSPGWAAHLDHYVDDGVTVVVLSNVYASVTTPIARAVGAMYFGLSPTPMPALRADPLAPAESARLVGTYRFGADYYVPNSTVTIVENDGHIQAQYPSDYPASAYIPITSTRFIVRPFWMPAEFILDSNGKASKLVLDGFTGKRE